jgi:hypothetical protein
MKLRDHPAMNHRAVPNWPPTWTRSRKEKVKTVHGEVGTLAYVYANELVSDKCYLVMDYDQETYVGCLIFDSRAFCGQIVKLLRQHLGRAINEIGDLDVSHLA